MYANMSREEIKELIVQMSDEELKETIDQIYESDTKVGCYIDSDDKMRPLIVELDEAKNLQELICVLQKIEDYIMDTKKRIEIDEKNFKEYVWPWAYAQQEKERRKDKAGLGKCLQVYIN